MCALGRKIVEATNPVEIPLALTPQAREGGRAGAAPHAAVPRGARGTRPPRLPHVLVFTWNSAQSVSFFFDLAKKLLAGNRSPTARGVACDRILKLPTNRTSRD
jgi:hypothetical protein